MSPIACFSFKICRSVDISLRICRFGTTKNLCCKLLSDLGIPTCDRKCVGNEPLQGKNGHFLMPQNWIFDARIPKRKHFLSPTLPKLMDWTPVCCTYHRLVLSATLFKSEVFFWAQFIVFKDVPNLENSNEKRSRSSIQIWSMFHAS